MKISIIAALLLAATTAFAQQYQWAHSLMQPARSHTVAIAADQYGDSYVVGVRRHGTSSLFSQYPCGDIFITKNDPNGGIVWTVTFSGNACALDAICDPLGNIIITGGFFDSLRLGDHFFKAAPFTSSSFLARITAAGTVFWAVSDSGDQNKLGLALALGPDNSIYECRFFDDITASFANYTAGGNRQWENPIPEVRSFDDIAVDKDGNIYLSGTCTPSAIFDTMAVPASSGASGYVTFACSFTPDRKGRWLRSEKYGTFGIANTMALLGGLLRYRYTNDPTTKTLEVLALETGEVLYSKEVPVSLSSFNQYLPNTIAWKPNGIEFYIGESSRDTILIYKGHFFFTTDGEILAFDTLSVIPAAYGITEALAATSDGVYLAGSYIDSHLLLTPFTIENPNDASKSENDLFLTKIDPASGPLSVAPAPTITELLVVYPNPSADYISLGAGYATANYRIYSSTGVCVASGISGDRISVAALASGAYQIVIDLHGTRQHCCFIKQ